MPSHTPPLAVPSANVIAELVAIVGDAHAITDPDKQTAYLTEWRDRYQGKTPVVLKPGTVEEVSALLKLANRHHIGVVTQAGNTGLVGGQIARPSGTDVVLSVERLNQMRSIDPANRHLVVEAGVPLAAAQAMANQAGLAFPLRMASEGSACVGGAIATNAGGVHVLAHGSMRALTLGLEVVLANGDIWHGLRGLKKDNTGYDLRDLMVGSEGTLGVITAATLKLVPHPSSVATAMLGVQKLEDVQPIFAHLSARLGLELTAFEFMSAQSLKFVTDTFPNARNPLSQNCPWSILVEVSSSRAGTEAQDALQQSLSDERILSVLSGSALAVSDTQAQDFWRLRELISEAQKHGGGSIKHDISVPSGQIADFIPEANALVEKLCPGARPCPFGHFGDGNIHYNISQPEGGDKDAFLRCWNDVQSAVHDLVIAYGGSISAEHGIGVMKREALVRAKSSVELNMMRAIKQALDPNGILNPGKLL